MSIHQERAWVVSWRSIPLAKSYTYEKLCVKRKSPNCKRALLVQKTLQNFFIIENITFTTYEDVLAHDHNN